MESSPRQPRDFSLACGTVHLDAEGGRPPRMQRLMSRRKQTTWPLVRGITVSQRAGK